MMTEWRLDAFKNEGYEGTRMKNVTYESLIFKIYHIIRR